MDSNWRDKLPAEGVSQEKAPISGVLVNDGKVLVPALTPEEVAASTASRGKKMVAVRPPEFCTPWQFKEVMAATFMLYMKFGELPTWKEIVEVVSPNVPEGKIKKIVESPEFRHAMLVRGVDYSIGRTITPEQDMAIAIMSAPDGRPFERKLKAAGVAPSKWRAWLKQKAFREVWESIGGSALKDFEGDMMAALIGQALAGDTGAIKYAFEVSGRHNPARQNNIDATVFMAQVLEIIQDEVKDTETLQRIGARMQMVAGSPAGQNVTAHLRNREIEA